MFRKSIMLMLTIGTLCSSIASANSVQQYCPQNTDFVLDLRVDATRENLRKVGFAEHVTQKEFRAGKALLKGHLLLWSDIFELRGDSVFVDLSFPSTGHRNLLVGQGSVSEKDSNYFCGMLAKDVVINEVREIVYEEVFPFPGWVKVKTAHHKYKISNKKDSKEYRTSFGSLSK